MNLPVTSPRHSGCGGGTADGARRTLRWRAPIQPAVRAIAKIALAAPSSAGWPARSNAAECEVDIGWLAPADRPSIAPTSSMTEPALVDRAWRRRRDRTALRPRVAVGVEEMAPSADGLDLASPHRPPWLPPRRCASCSSATTSWLEALPCNGAAQCAETRADDARRIGARVEAATRAARVDAARSWSASKTSARSAYRRHGAVVLVVVSRGQQAIGERAPAVAK